MLETLKHIPFLSNTVCIIPVSLNIAENNVVGAIVANFSIAGGVTLSVKPPANTTFDIINDNQLIATSVLDREVSETKIQWLVFNIILHRYKVAVISIEIINGWSMFRQALSLCWPDIPLMISLSYVCIVQDLDHSLLSAFILFADHRRLSSDDYLQTGGHTHRSK